MIGGFPLIDPKAKNAQHFNLTDFLISIFHAHGKQLLVMNYVTPNVDNSTEYLLSFSVDNPFLGTPEYYLEEKYSNIVDALRKYLRQVIQLLANDFNYKLNETNLTEQLESIIAFDRELAQIRNNTEMASDVRKNFMQINLSELYVMFPMVDWNRYLCETWGKDIQDYLKTNPRIYINYPDEFFGLSKLLLQTDDRSVANYLVMNYVLMRVSMLDQRFDNLSQVSLSSIHQYLN